MQREQPLGTARESPGVTVGFHGYGPNEQAGPARAFEDEVLALTADYGGRVVFRGTRKAGQLETEPLEFHVLWFPDQSSFNGYLNDKRRADAIERHGEVFVDKRVVLLDALTGL
jgi:hypothetical protein